MHVPCITKIRLVEELVKPCVVIFQFIQSCGKYLGDHQFDLKKLAIKRYRECADQFKQSDDFAALVKKTTDKMGHDKERQFVHLRDFLDILKRNNKKKRPYPADSSENDSDCAIAKAILNQKKTFTDNDTDSDSAVEFIPKRRKIETTDEVEARVEHSGEGDQNRFSCHRTKRKQSNDKTVGETVEISDESFEDHDHETIVSDHSDNKNSQTSEKIPMKSEDINEHERINNKETETKPVLEDNATPIVEINDTDKIFSPEANEKLETADIRDKHKLQSEESKEHSIDSKSKPSCLTEKTKKKGSKNLETSRSNDQYSNSPLLFDEDEDQTNTCENVDVSDFENDKEEEEILVAVPCASSEDGNSKDATYYDDNEECDDEDQYIDDEDVNNPENSVDVTADEEYATHDHLENSFEPQQKSEDTSYNADESENEESFNSSQESKHYERDVSCEEPEQNEQESGNEHKDKSKFGACNSDNEKVGFESVAEDSSMENDDGEPAVLDRSDSVQIISEDEDIIENSSKDNHVENVNNNAGDGKYRQYPTPRNPTLVKDASAKVVCLLDESKKESHVIRDVSGSQVRNVDIVGEKKVIENIETKIIIPKDKTTGRKPYKSQIAAVTNISDSDSEPRKHFHAKRKAFPDSSSDEEDPEYANKAKRFKEKRTKSYRICVGKKDKSGKKTKKSRTDKERKPSGEKNNHLPHGHSIVDEFKKSDHTNKPDKSVKRHAEHSHTKHHTELSPRRHSHKKRSPNKSPKKSPIIIVTESESENDVDDLKQKAKERLDQKLKFKLELNDDPKIPVEKLHVKGELSDSDSNFNSGGDVITKVKPDCSKSKTNMEDEISADDSDIVKDGKKKETKRALLTTLEYYKDKSVKKDTGSELGKFGDIDDTFMRSDKNTNRSDSSNDDIRHDRKHGEKERSKHSKVKDKRENKPSHSRREEDRVELHSSKRERNNDEENSDRESGKKKGSTKQILRLETLLEVFETYV